MERIIVRALEKLAAINPSAHQGALSMQEVIANQVKSDC